MKIKMNKKFLYLLGVFVITLLILVISPTYAKFASEYTTDDDIVGLSLDFNVTITNVEEYEELVIPAGGTEKFNINIVNNLGSTAYYGIWYWVDSDVSSDVEIGKLEGTDVATSGEIANNNEVTVSIAVINNSSSKVKLRIGVGSSTTSTSDIEYLSGKKLITGTVSIPKDIMITSIKIDGIESDSLPTSGAYTMTYSCPKGSTLSWNTINKNITYGSGSKIGDNCSVEFTTATDYDYPLLNTMPVGSYVAYVGSGGYVGNTSVACQIDGDDSSSIATDETEAPNSCYGQNAREDLDTSGYTYGYCYSANYKYYTTGWRIAYIDSNNKPVIVSAGSPECNTRIKSATNETYILTANAKALKYCNTDYVDGNCTCTDDYNDGTCTSASSDAWAINDTDFYYMTKAISGIGKRLTNGSSSLGDSGGTLGSTLYCNVKCSYQECGYNNDLIDNGGFYWFAAQYSSSSTYGVEWFPSTQSVSTGYSSTDAYGLRPVISLSSSVYVTGGSGTMDDPYTIAK